MSSARVEHYLLAYSSYPTLPLPVALSLYFYHFLLTVAASITSLAIRPSTVPASVPVPFSHFALVLSLPLSLSPSVTSPSYCPCLCPLQSLRPHIVPASVSPVISCRSLSVSVSMSPPVLTFQAVPPHPCRSPILLSAVLVTVPAGTPAFLALPAVQSNLSCHGPYRPVRMLTK